MKKILIYLLLGGLAGAANAHDTRPGVQHCANPVTISSHVLTGGAIRMLVKNRINYNVGALSFSKTDEFNGLPRPDGKGKGDCDVGSTPKTCGFIDLGSRLDYGPWAMAYEAALTVCSDLYIDDKPRVTAWPEITAPAEFLDDQVDSDGTALHHSLYSLPQGIAFNCVYCPDDIPNVNEFLKQKDLPEGHIR